MLCTCAQLKATHTKNTLFPDFASGQERAIPAAVLLFTGNPFIFPEAVRLFSGGPIGRGRPLARRQSRHRARVVVG